jgi:hypothetical protein
VARELTAKSFYIITIPPANKAGVVVSPPNLEPQYTSQKWLNCNMKIELKASPLVMLIKYPDIIDACCPVDTSLQVPTLASLNILGMMKIHVVKN